MAALTDLPDNKNFLSPLGFTFTIKKTPGVNYFVQSVDLPGISMGTADVQTPFVRLPFPGDKIDFTQLSITFRVDEDMNNYKELFDWLIAIGYPESTDQYKAIAPRNRFGGTGPEAITGAGIFSDASLIVLNSVKAPIIDYQFKNLFPVGLSSLSFDTRNSDVEYLDVTATFAYESFRLNYIT